MNFFSKTFVRGTLTLLPLILTIYPIWYFFSWLDELSNSALQAIHPGLDTFPGTGIILGLIAIFLLGLLMSSRFMQRLYSLFELPFTRIPLVKSLYTAIKELTRFLAPSDDRKKANKVVLVRMPDNDASVVGFVVQEELQRIDDSLKGDDKVAVYIPMSYQVGGFTLFLPRDWLTETSLSVEDAMKNVLTGWMTSE